MIDLILKNFLYPSIAALFILTTGWGNLLLFAIKTKTLRNFLRHPGFMIGDLVILPMVGFLVIFFYRLINSLHIFTLSYFTISIALVSLVLSLLNAYRSLFVWKTVKFNLLLVPHFFFYWFMSYILISFFVIGLWEILFNPNIFILSIYFTVAAGVVTHFILPMIFGPKKFSN